MEKEFKCSTCWNMQYELLKDVFFDSKEENEDYILCTSKVITRVPNTSRGAPFPPPSSR